MHRRPLLTLPIRTSLHTPVIGCLCGVAFWGLCAAIGKLRQRLKSGGDGAPSRGYYLPRIKMTIGLILFWLYPQISTTVISILVACTPVDKAAAIDPAYMPPLGVESLGNATAALKAGGQYWDLDTGLRCFQGPMRWLLALGVIWAVGFCAGFPAAMAALLTKKKAQLTDPTVSVDGRVTAPAIRSCLQCCHNFRSCTPHPPTPRSTLPPMPPAPLPQIELQYGFFFNSYRLKYYYWESVILGEKLALALVLTATQRFGAPPQMLAAQVVLLLALMLQIKCRPYGGCIS
jgi:hypothetical protein